ncbi:MAG: hypothetical protein KIT11_01290 [Fimbriimonadaceae bacterium]|nr:hypothetical protein [Fimbriimonadaceae bacterium]QYK54992.1 MAG: hypothetical protein KF733_08245 [Fimbriimonadaceae bacterium]
MVALGQYGCADRQNWSGEWVGRYELPKGHENDPVEASLAKVTLTIKPDGSFTLIEAGFDKTGRVLSSGKSATLVVERVMGRVPERMGSEAAGMGGERKLEMNEDGTLKFWRKGVEPVELRREAQR